MALSSIFTGNFITYFNDYLNFVWAEGEFKRQLVFLDSYANFDNLTFLKFENLSNGSKVMKEFIKRLRIPTLIKIGKSILFLKIFFIGYSFHPSIYNHLPSTLKFECPISNLLPTSHSSSRFANMNIQYPICCQLHTALIF